MCKVIICLSVLIFFSCSTIEKDVPQKIVLTDNWQFKGIDTLNWKPAIVPGNIFTDLLAHQIIEDPFIKTNEKKVQWVSKKNWEYKTTFTLSNKILNKKNIALNFEGLDTYAKIYINGNYQFDTNNAFKKYSIPVKKILKKENELRIVFFNTDEIEKVKSKNNPYKLPEGKRIYTRKAQFQYGWDWGPKLNTSGIWKDVYIKAWNDFKIDQVFIRQEKITKNKANLVAEISILSDVETSSEVKIVVDQKEFHQKINLKKGTYTYKIPIDIKNPKLWWTHNLGNPHLYQFDFELISDKKIKDTKTIKKGIRTIKLISEKDSIGESFYFELNGKPVFMKGANYIPQNSFQNKVTDNHYKKLLSDVVNSNMNMLRVWGGGIYENDIFYDLCDEKGILVWQDFMFACAMYPGDIAFLANIEEEATQQVKKLRNHTSIALWCGNNENSEGWKRWGWQTNRTEKEKQDIWNDYLAVFDSILPKTVSKYSQTDYWETSPKYGRGNIKYKTEGDAHDWWIWHDAYPFEHLQKNVPRFMSEFGFQSFPSFETINYINQKDTIDLKTDAIKSHQKHVRGFQLIDEYMSRDYKIPTNDEDYAYVSQLLQAKGIVMGIEAQRRAKPYNMGTLFWQLNDCWPAISWSSIDYFGKWKALQYKAKKAYKNVLISTDFKNNKVLVYLVNDNFKSIRDYLNIELVDFSGNVLWSEKKLITIEENISKKIYELDIKNKNIDTKKTYLRMKFNNGFKISFLEKPKNLLLEKSEIIKNITKFGENQFLITLESKTLQKDIFLYTSEKGHFSDNFFDLEPNEVEAIFFETDAKTLNDLKVKSLNSIN